MNSKESRKISNEVNKTKASIQSEKIYKDIRLAAQLGKYKIHYNGTIVGYVITQLKDDGYILTSTDISIPEMCNISW